MESVFIDEATDIPEETWDQVNAGFSKYNLNGGVL